MQTKKKTKKCQKRKIIIIFIRYYSISVHAAAVADMNCKAHCPMSILLLLSLLFVLSSHSMAYDECVVLFTFNTMHLDFSGPKTIKSLATKELTKRAKKNKKNEIQFKRTIEKPVIVDCENDENKVKVRSMEVKHPNLFHELLHFLIQITKPRRIMYE